MASEHRRSRHGPALVLVPGIQGRWEYLRPAVDALARVVSRDHVLARATNAGRRARPARGFDVYADQVDARARRSAHRAGDDLRRLVRRPGRAAIRRDATASGRARWSSRRAPGPAGICVRGTSSTRALPWLFGPLFLAETPFRLRREDARGAARTRRPRRASRGGSCARSSPRRSRWRGWRRARG